jgi:hypothetical protein
MLQLSLGIAGTAKNTGKTTATAAILEELRLRGIPISITSIGYDGEDMDTITGLPKPKLRLEPGDIIATADKCIKASTAGLSMIEDTKIVTPLGKIFIAEVKRAGLAVTAGPNKRSDVRVITRLLERIRPGVILVDGALNRIAPMSETDGIILATGAARTPNIVTLSEETSAFAKIAALPTTPDAVAIADRSLDGVTLFGPELSELRNERYTSLLTEKDIEGLLGNFPPDGSQLYVPGIISKEALIALKKMYQKQPRRLFLAFQDTFKALIIDDPAGVYQELNEMEEYGILTGVLKRVPLFAITINPFYPEFRVDDNSYRKAFIDPVRLELAMKAQTHLPVYNVVRHGARGLVDAVLLNRGRWESPLTVTF